MRIKQKILRLTVLLLIFLVLAIQLVKFPEIPTSGNILLDPLSSFLMGSDLLGRSVALRLGLATITSFVVCMLTVVMVSIISVIFLILMTGVSERIERVSVLVLDILTSVPSLFWLVIIYGLLGSGGSKVAEILMLSGAIAVTGWMGVVRSLKIESQRIMQSDYFLASRALGASQLQIVGRHYFLAMGPLLVAAMVARIPYFVLKESFISFLGFGISAPGVSLGLLVRESVEVMEVAPHLLIFSSLALFLLVRISRGLFDYTLNLKSKISPS